jgi:fibronectin-binding autotransporter adhesin
VAIASVTYAGADKDNYTFSASPAGVGAITQLSSATWVGGTGDWMNAANWGVTGALGQTGVLPDGGNVGVAVLPTGFAGVVTTSADHAHAGKIQINGGTLSVSADSQLGAVPSSAVADAITLNGGTLQATSSFTTSSNRGLSIGASGGTINPGTGVSLVYAGAASGAGSLVKTGAGTLALTGTLGYTGSTTTSAGGLIIRNDAPVWVTSSFFGSGALTVEPASASFTSPVTLDFARFGSVLGSLTVGKAGNTQNILLQTNVSTSGQQNYYGPLVLSGQNVVLTSSNAGLRVGNVDSDSTPRTCLLYTSDAADE